MKLIFLKSVVYEASKEVVLLSALGVISYQDGELTFRPQDTLTAKDLAVWLGPSIYGLEGTTSTELAKQHWRKVYYQQLMARQRIH